MSLRHENVMAGVIYIRTFLFPVLLIGHDLLEITRSDYLQYEKVSLVLPFKSKCH